MVFHCQNYPYHKKFSSVVVSCEPSHIETCVNGKKDKIVGFDVVLQDTVFFPEGGGQPDDRGFLAGAPVLRVKRRGAEAVHFTTSEFTIGDLVEGEIDWKRRWDHMQQHSGQHLITAITDNLFGVKTTSWWLGDTISHIELDSATLTEQQIEQIEINVNEKIRAAVPVQVKVYEEGDETLRQVRTRGLPEDHVGQVRVVTMEGIDSNMCCGTHVSNLSELQMVKLLSCEKGKKGKTNLFFLCGQRVLDYAHRCSHRENQLTAIFKNGPEDHVELAKKLQNSVKISQKTIQSLMRELAGLEAAKVKAINPKFHAIHRKDADMDFANVLISELAGQDTVLLVTIGEDNAGQMILSGPTDAVQQLGPRICEVLSGKGAGKGKRFQAKVAQMSAVNRQQAEDILAQYFL